MGFSFQGFLCCLCCTSLLTEAVLCLCQSISEPVGMWVRASVWGFLTESQGEFIFNTATKSNFPVVSQLPPATWSKELALSRNRTIGENVQLAFYKKEHSQTLAAGSILVRVPSPNHRLQTQLQPWVLLSPWSCQFRFFSALCVFLKFSILKIHVFTIVSIYLVGIRSVSGPYITRGHFFFLFDFSYLFRLNKRHQNTSIISQVGSTLFPTLYYPESLRVLGGIIAFFPF